MIDFKYWDLRDEFTIDEAFYLWFNVESGNQNIPGDIRKKIDQMRALFLEKARNNQVINVSGFDKGSIPKADLGHFVPRLLEAKIIKKDDCYPTRVCFDPSLKNDDLSSFGKVIKESPLRLIERLKEIGITDDPNIKGITAVWHRSNRNNMSYTTFPYSDDPSKKINRATLVRFALSIEQKPPFLFHSERTEDLKNQKLSEDNEKMEQIRQEPEQAMQEPYLDNNNKYFCPELEAAVSVWKALFVDGEYKEGKKNYKKQIEDWIKKNRKNAVSTKGEISNNAVKRIAVMCNPHKKGGAKPT